MRYKNSHFVSYTKQNTSITNKKHLSYITNKNIYYLCTKNNSHEIFTMSTMRNPPFLQVTTDHVIIPVNEQDSLEGFDLETLYCLGCSWSGSPKSLKRY